MKRITDSDLQHAIDIINSICGTPKETYIKDDTGKFKAQIGNYHIDGAYGGVSLHQIVSEGGGVKDVFSCGHTTKRDLYQRMQAYIDGLSRGAQ